MIHVLAKIDIDPAQRDAFLAAFAKVTPLVRAEDGCLEYGLAVDEPTGIQVQQMLGDGAVMVVEKWESVAALNAHLAAPHMDAYREETAAMVRGLTLQVLRPATD